MKGFLTYLIKFSVPIFLYVLIIILIDPFKILFEYDNYYTRPVGINRDFVSTRNFLKYNDSLNYNSFIFGSSRSQAFKIAEWRKYINGVPFHFDGFGESLFGVYTKVKYIDRVGNNIDNVLIVCDHKLLEKVYDHENRISLKHPEIAGTSWVRFYRKHFKDAINPRFIVAYIDFSIFHKKRTYMNQYIEGYGPYCYNYSNDLYYTIPDNEIKKDSVAYYDKMSPWFVREKTGGSMASKVINNRQKLLLTEMRDIFKKHNTKVKIVICPGYDQIILNREDLSFLENEFGSDNVFDFSGVNYITENRGYHYEAYHFRPNAANIVLSEVYKDQLNLNLSQKGY